MAKELENSPFSLIDKTILITGASSGIGKQCAISCSNAGAKVILFGRDEKRLEETYKQLGNKENHAKFSVDLTNYSEVKKSLDEIINSYGKVNGIINSAGISTTLPLKMINPEKLIEYYSQNVVSSINLSGILSQKKYFSEDGGSIIFLSSVMGVVGEAGKTIYSLTKGALISGAKSMALELASRKIRVNTISPGVVETPMSQNAVYSQGEETINNIKKMHPLGLGNPEDIANACVYLLSNASRWMTGTNLIIDGGYTAR